MLQTDRLSRSSFFLFTRSDGMQADHPGGESFCRVDSGRSLFGDETVNFLPPWKVLKGLCLFENAHVAAMCRPFSHSPISAQCADQSS